MRRKRPRAECPVCHKLVALHVDGRLWDHMYPGHGMWDPGIGRSCIGKRPK